MNKRKMNLIGLNQNEIFDTLIDNQIISEKEKFRVKQIWHWIYFQGTAQFSAMSTLSKTLQDKLTEIFTIERPIISDHQVSRDGTQKWLLQLEDKNLVEMVYIHLKLAGALCVCHHK